ncbi:MAG: RsmB/NOP family class I SAM-dependent RNA methyltransferase [Sphingomonadales bacterium]|nr:RsmB/NOP family class I SAM-dependent RNA methyltransferase [Sphingomonadales bacterium]
MATDETLNSRRLAFDILRNITEKKETFDVALISGMANYPAMEERDRAFARHLITTCLRHLPFLDGLIDGAMDAPLEDRNLGTRNWLRLGITQILYMNVENHAAVHTTVELISNSPTKGIRGKKGLANAILRRFAKNSEQLLEKSQSDATANIAPWLRERWLKQYGIEELKLVSEALLIEPPLDLTVKDKTQIDAIVANLNGQKLGNYTCRLPKAGEVTGLKGFNEGQWWVQDFAASLPVQLMGDVKGKNIADLCAAPGGKTMQLASAGANVTAVDVSKKRLLRLEENLKRTNLSAKIIASNILKWHPEQLFDGILLDAPCTATGTMRRRPDVPINKTVDDVLKLSGVQKNLLEHSFKQLKTNGTLIYCTCSLEQEEGEDVIKNFLENTPSAKRIPFTANDIGPLSSEIKTEKGDIRTLPSILGDIGGMDGFFISRLTKQDI